MTTSEFAAVMGFLESACGKPLPPKALDVYFELLGDLPVDVLRLSAQRVALEHPWANFPSIAELRAAAAEIVRGLVKEVSPAESWELAWRAAGRIDLEIDGSADRAMNGLPEIVQEAMRAYSIPSLVYGKDPVGVIRGQFLKIFEQLAARDRRIALLPAAMKKKIVETGDRPPVIQKVLDQIGVIGE